MYSPLSQCEEFLHEDYICVPFRGVCVIALHPAQLIKQIQVLRGPIVVGHLSPYILEEENFGEKIAFSIHYI